MLNIATKEKQKWKQNEKKKNEISHSQFSVLSAFVEDFFFLKKKEKENAKNSYKRKKKGKQGEKLIRTKGAKKGTFDQAVASKDTGGLQRR